MSSGIGVLCIQKFRGASSGKTKIIPALSSRCLRNISPTSRCGPVLATSTATVARGLSSAPTIETQGPRAHPSNANRTTTNANGPIRMLKRRCDSPSMRRRKSSPSMSRGKSDQVCFGRDLLELASRSLRQEPHDQWRNYPEDGEIADGARVRAGKIVEHAFEIQ